MKFLVLTRPNGTRTNTRTAEEASKLAREVKRLHEKNIIEAAFAFIGGGSAFVLNADTTKQLAILIRSNPLFSTQHHEIIPVADATDFLQGLSEHLAETATN